MEFVSDWEFVLGVPMFSKQKRLKRRPKRDFTTEEDKFIKKNWLKMSNKDIGITLDRFPETISKRGLFLGMPKKSKPNGKKQETTETVSEQDKAACPEIEDECVAC